jgi:hypothetical protein
MIGFHRKESKGHHNLFDIDNDTRLVGQKPFESYIGSDAPIHIGPFNEGDYETTPDNLKKIHDYLIEEGFTPTPRKFTPSKPHTPNEECVLLESLGDYHSYMIGGRLSAIYWQIKTPNWVRVRFCLDDYDIYSNSEDLALKIANGISSFYQEKKRIPDTPQVSLILKEGNSLRLAEFELAPLNTELFSLNYNEDTLNFLNKAQDTLTKEYKGIYLLWGLPGTGKSTAIQYLSARVQRNFIFIPSGMDNIICEPNFLDLIKSYPKSVLVLEDAENALTERKDSGRTAIANILNMSDGILGAALQISIIATFNCNIEKIDPALLRNGRCKGKHEFKFLTKEKIEALSNHFKIDMPSEPMPLCDFYQKYSEIISEKETPISLKKQNQREKEVLERIELVTKVHNKLLNNLPFSDLRKDLL